MGMIAEDDGFSTRSSKRRPPRPRSRCAGLGGDPGRGVGARMGADVPNNTFPCVGSRSSRTASGGSAITPR